MTNMPSDNCVFAGEIDDSNGNRLAPQFTAPFALNDSTFVDGCPLPGQLVSTDFGS